ncbi:MAG: AAA family ATPase [Chromatiaceae bacterium]|nr:AAA family ATPase [Chromatiaceae bacterium]
MPRADLIVDLVKAGTRGDRGAFARLVESMAAEERAKNHSLLADRLVQGLNLNGNGRKPLGLAVPDEKAAELLHEIVPRRSLASLVLPNVARIACGELVEEHHRTDLLRTYNLEPRHRVLLAGPPGNGKTTLAEALADALMVPLYVVRYEAVIGSFLGETSQRLRRVFEHVASRRCVLFFDEFDTLGKERGDTHETGEIKRVVSTLLMQIDALPSHVVTVVASNHPELLDRAVWRRFQLRLELPPPNQATLEEWFRRFQDRLGEPLGWPPRSLAMRLKGLSFAEAEQFGEDVLRRHVLALPDSNLKRIVQTRLEAWQQRFTVKLGEPALATDRTEDS